MTSPISNKQNEWARESPQTEPVPTKSKSEKNSQRRALGPPEIRAVSQAKSVHSQMGAGFYFSGALPPGEQVGLQLSSAWVLQNHSTRLKFRPKGRILKCLPPPHIQGMREIPEQQPQLVFPWNICRYLGVGSIRHWGPLPMGFVSQGIVSGCRGYGTFGLQSRSAPPRSRSSQDNEQVPSHLPPRQFRIQMG